MITPFEKATSWFATDEAESQYLAFHSLADKTVFLYSFLKSFAKESFEENNILFRTAFFLADEISKSNLPYSDYKSIVDLEKNPFAAYIKNAGGCQPPIWTFAFYLAILNEKVNVHDPSEWIYDLNFTQSLDIEEKLKEKECCFLPEIGVFYDPSIFVIKPELQMLLLEAYWLFSPELNNRIK